MVRNFTPRAVCFVCMVTLAGCDQQPSYSGRTLSSWMYDIDSEQDFERRNACEAIGEMGVPAQKAIPKLVERLDDSNPGVREFAELALAKMGQPAVVPLESALARDEPVIRLHAAAALINIDAKHAKAGEELVSAVTGVGNADLSDKARDVLVALGEPGAALLQSRLNDPYTPVRLFLVKTMGKIGKKASSSVPALAELARTDKDQQVRLAAIKAMAMIGPATAVETTFRELLEDPDEDVAGTAGSMLAFVGTRESATGTEGVGEEKTDKDAVGKTEHLNIVNQPADE
ncbi:MAG: hypothetical protein A2289_17160 [Deltaproteobacteria bacterium RIFOXYA12_FULL_58_15]|nr:MAG: hypothetical protein A2289_17160 [Deltaproteobacteria bacterium RIFOXYA12_FULL_58_15]